MLGAMWRLIPVILSCLLLAAHFLRYGQVLSVVLWIAFPFLLLIRAKWIPWFFHALLTLGTALWIRIAFRLWTLRELTAQPRLRMAIILGLVALFTAASIGAFWSRKVREHYQN